MREIINFLKKAVDRDRVGAYVFRDGAVYAQNGKFQAGAPLSLGLEMCVSAEELEKGLDRMTDDPKIKVNDGVVTVTQGRLRQTMRVLDGADAERMPLDQGGWRPVPDGFTAALELAAKFAGEGNWTEGIRIWGDRVTAINNRCGVDVAGAQRGEPVLIKKDAAAFIGEYQPDEMLQLPNALAFRWGDGRWLRAQLLADKFPQVVEEIFNGLGDVAPCLITEDWRDAYADAAAMTDNLLTLLPDRFLVERLNQASIVEVAARTDVPAGHRSKWSKAVLDAVVPVAEAWNPDAWPKWSLFLGRGFRGVCMGVQR